MLVTTQLEIKIDSKTQLDKCQEREVGSLERAVCSAQRMTGELPSPQSETRHRAAAAACPPTPAKSHTSAHSPLGTAQRADWETGTHHLSVAINPPLHFCWRASNTQCAAHISSAQSKNTSKRTLCGMCSCSMHEASTACRLQFLC